MSLTKKDKIKICKHYDTILSKLKPISAFMEEPFYPNFINYDYSPTEEEVKHATNAYSIATHFTSKVSSRSRHDILGFIATPEFLPEIVVHTTNYKEQTRSLEDSILYRGVKDTIITKTSKNNPNDTDITRCITVQLSDEIYYLNEKTLVISTPILLEIKRKLAKKHKIEYDCAELDALIWSEVEQAGEFKESFSERKNVHKKESLDNYMIKKYGQAYDPESWQYKGIIRLDNRRTNEKTGEVITLTETYKKSLK